MPVGVFNSAQFRPQQAAAAFNGAQGMMAGAPRPPQLDRIPLGTNPEPKPPAEPIPRELPRPDPAVGTPVVLVEPSAVVEPVENAGLFRAALADTVKHMLKEHYQAGTVDKEAFKTITRKSVEKLFNAHQHEVKATPAGIEAFMTVTGRKDKIKKLVEAYVKVHRVKKEIE